jgi:primosomal protein N' (replication factor Y) (superfamily II helicase)
VCNEAQLMFKGLGTKALVSEVQGLFPAAKIARFDSDSTGPMHLSKRYDEVASGKIDILIGTQSVAKGLDLPKLSLICVVRADASVDASDYRGEEVGFQTLSQVIGRVGRGHQESTIAIQTYNPDSVFIRDVLVGNYTDFYNRQISERKKYLYPPFAHAMTISTRAKISLTAEKRLKTLLESVVKLHSKNIRVLGPAPKIQHKQGPYYHWQIVILSKQRGTLVGIAKNLTSQFNFDLEPTSLL